MKSITPYAVPMKTGAASNMTQVVGLSNTSTAKPASVTNAQINVTAASENVQAGLDKLTIGANATAAPAPERTKIGAARERRNDEIPAAGGAKGALSDIGESATAKGKRV